MPAAGRIARPPAAGTTGGARGHGSGAGSRSRGTRECRAVVGRGRAAGRRSASAGARRRARARGRARRARPDGRAANRGQPGLRRCARPAMGLVLARLGQRRRAARDLRRGRGRRSASASTSGFSNTSASFSRRPRRPAASAVPVARRSDPAARHREAGADAPLRELDEPGGTRRTQGPRHVVRHRPGGAGRARRRRMSAARPLCERLPPRSPRRPRRARRWRGTGSSAALRRPLSLVGPNGPRTGHGRGAAAGARRTPGRRVVDQVRAREAVLAHEDVGPRRLAARTPLAASVSARSQSSCPNTMSSG